MDINTKNNPQFRQGYLYAVRLLTASKKSEKEVAKRLKDKGYPGNIIEKITEELKGQGILSDEKLIRETVQWAAQAKRYGRRRIILDLKKRGMVSSEIEKALDDYPKAAERDFARSLAEARWERLKKVEPQKRKMRLYQFLLNRGFDFELSREIVAQMHPDSDETI